MIPKTQGSWKVSWEGISHPRRFSLKEALSYQYYSKTILNLCIVLELTKNKFKAVAPINFLLERGSENILNLTRFLSFKKIIIEVVAPDIWGGTRHLFFNRGTPRCLKGTKQNNVHLHLIMENQKNFSLLFLIYHKIRVLQFQKELSLSLFPLIRQAKF